MIVVLHLGDNALKLPTAFVSSLSQLHLDQGVQLFFVLSGFILNYIYPGLDGASAKRRFMIARFARIWPGHVAALAILLAGMPAIAIGNNDWPHLLANIFMVQSWLLTPDFIFSYNGPSWSIATEFGLYFFFLLLIRNFDRTYPLKIAISIALAAIFMFFAGNSYATLVSPIMHLFGFTCGMSAASIWRRGLFSVPSNKAYATCIEIGAVAVFLGNGYAADYLATLMPPNLGLWFQQFCFPSLAGAFLILILANRAGLISALLSTRPVVVLGEISYSIYLLHVVLLRILIAHQMLAFAPIINLMIYLGLTLLLSLLVWLVIERPMRKLIIERFDRLAQRPVETVAIARPVPGRLRSIRRRHSNRAIGPT
jgi:peptidoglycan/LPS O-acetylase OafA/YrhL